MINEEKDVESLVELGLRSMDIDFLKQNIMKIRAYTQRLVDKEFKDIFLGIRNNRFTFYYYGRELLTMDFNYKNFDDVVIRTRKEFGNNTELNNKLKEVVSNIPLIRNYDTVEGSIDISSSKNGGKYILNTTDLKGYSVKDACVYLLRGIKDVVRERYNGVISSELQVQGEYMTRYNFTNSKYKDLYMVDMEFILSKKVEEKIGSTVDGRYDMIGLYKTESDRYKLVFIELKSKKNAIIDDEKKKEQGKKTSGINSHIEDMDKFLAIYNGEDSWLKKLLVENINAIIEMKGEQNLKLFKGLDTNLIDYDDPEFWLLFDMVDGTKIDSIADIKKIIRKDINKMDLSNATLKFFKGCVRNNDNDYISELS